MTKKWVKKFLISDGIALVLLAAPLVYAVTPTEAPTGFDNLTNGFESQAQFNLDKANFDSREEIADGLGPIYNAQACSECHQNPVSGATSQITELRVGRFDGFTFTDRPGGSLNNDRAINAAIQERVAGADNVRDFRSSLNILGDGYVEAIPDSFFTNTRNNQINQLGVGGQIIRVPVAEGTPAGTTRIARFGWKNQHASLLDFAADAYLNEMGITSKLQPTENTSNGASTAAFDTVADPEDPPTVADPFGTDVGAFVRFMRSTKAPAPDTAVANNSDVLAGKSLFSAIGCSICHIASITTSPAGTVINNGNYTIPAAIGDKIIHPFSDFMLHDVGTGDGIVQNGGASTQFKLRTPPLWGLRTHDRLMHDTVSFTRDDAIQRHTNEAEPVIQNYLSLSVNQKNQLIAYINSL
ncbi:MAG TPA: di-heme oxidoredictase family protein [Thermoanaerobaculia bacterium]|nr:di-heme oxidoredictase family protein [Thermoanaerobaculia bacterium]